MPVDGLKQVYALYDTIMQEFDGVCRKGCAVCCTGNVTLTSLEARLLLEGFSRTEKLDLAGTIIDRRPEKRYIPKISLNRYAAMCMNREEAPEEENDPAWGRCPLLNGDTCTIYPVRPFGCRSLFSEIDCASSGIAQIPPLLLTINNVFLQFIEHMDQAGISGNLSDLLPFMVQQEQTTAPGELKHAPGVIMPPAGGYLISNRKIPVLMVPPEHRKRIRTIMDPLIRIQSGLNS